MAGVAKVALSSPLNISMACKVRLVNARLGIGGQRISDEKAGASMDDKDGRVGAEEEVDISAILLEGPFGAHDDG